MADEESSTQSGDRAASDLAALRESLTAAERRAATLAELTALMSEGRDPFALAQRAVELTARATRAAGAFVYLWDREEERLVLRVATDGWQRGHLGRIKLRVGEGITGWSALMRQTVVIPKNPLKDPRCKPFPELRETAFKSMVAVPIVAPGEDVLGVFTLYGSQPNAFTGTDVSLASEVGALLASGLVQAETLGQLRVQSAAARFLTDLPDEAWGSVEQCLGVMARECAVHLGAEVCVIEVTAGRAQPHDTTSVVGMTQQFGEEHGLNPLSHELDRATLSQVLEPLNLERLRQPLGVPTPIGAVTCYRSRRFTQDDEVLLDAIGAQIAVGVLSLFGADQVRPVVEQLLNAADAATTKQLLQRQGWEPRPTWAVLLRVHRTPTADPRADDDSRIRAALSDVLGDDDGFLLLGGSGHYLALAEDCDPSARDLLVGRLGELRLQPGIRLIAGVGPVATTAQETHRAIRHAQVAAQWAELCAVSGPRQIVRYEDIAHLRLLPSTALAMSTQLRELLGAFGTIVDYDLENGTELAQTLDAFLASSGSVARTSEQLFIHRNTLRQRIQRIEELIGLAPETFDDWIAAGVAARLVRQSESDLSGQPNALGKARCPHGVLTIGRACCGMPANCVLAPRTVTPLRGSAGAG